MTTWVEKSFSQVWSRRLLTGALVLGLVVLIDVIEGFHAPLAREFLLSIKCLTVAMLIFIFLDRQRRSQRVSKSLDKLKYSELLRRKPGGTA